MQLKKMQKDPNLFETCKLTQYSKGAGCGCKIAPGELDKILISALPKFIDDKILVGNNTKDDAAVYDMGNGTALITTTDFFTPIVDDAFTYGKIAAANSISDVYAMGGRPIIAIAVLGWPVGKLPAEEAQKVLEGGRFICNEAGISLAGGHSIDSPEPFFGLAVNGLVEIKNLKRNSSSKAGDLLYLTKPLGTGIIATAEKKGIVKQAHIEAAIENMCKLNIAGAKISSLKAVSAMTDITGFGLLGHLIEMAEPADLTAEINIDKIPLLPGIDEYLHQMCYPDNTFRNWSAYSSKVNSPPGNSLFTLCDPQTNGGLLIAVEPSEKSSFEKIMKEGGLTDLLEPIGVMKKKNGDGKFVIIN